MKILPIASPYIHNNKIRKSVAIFFITYITVQSYYQSDGVIIHGDR